MKYEYGVEYETNGEKPDLPDDVLVHVMFDGEWEDCGDEFNAVRNWDWVRSQKFRIVDGRYKPKEQNMNDWHERGELPPVGVECEYKPINYWTRCTPLFFGESKVVLKVQEFEVCLDIQDIKFRPLRTETDKLVEQMLADIDKGLCWHKDVAESLIKAGYRKIKQQSEDEFVSDARSRLDVLKYEQARQLYRAGCRFIEQGSSYD